MSTFFCIFVFMKNVLYRQEVRAFYSVEFKDTSTIIPENTINDLLLYDDSEHYTFKHPKFTSINHFNDEETFLVQMKNQLFSVTSIKSTIVVEEYDDKVTIKLFWSHFGREVGKQWFRVIRNVDYITVNKKTGDIYSGYIHDYQKKRKNTKRVRRNFFSNDPLDSFTTKIKNFLNGITPNAGRIAIDAVNIFIDAITTSDTQYNREQRLFKFYLDKKGFRYPNNFYVYSNVMSDKELKKILKKNNKRIVESFMIKNKLNGKKIRKALHQTKYLNMNAYIFAQKIFGDDWLNQNEESLIKILDYTSEHYNVNYEFKNFLSKEELKRVFNLYINSVCEYQIDHFTFLDHIEMYGKLKEYGEIDIKWLSDGSDYNEFMEEHLDWTNKLEHYKNGTYFRIYPNYFFKIIENPIEEYYPVILTNSIEYNQESIIQSNCVKGYIGRPGSFIISLRKGSRDSEDRATIEYKVGKFDGEVIAKRVQSLGRFNYNLDESWDEILLKLDEIVLSSHQDKSFKSVELKKECLNNFVMTSDSYFDDLGDLVWSHKKENIYFI